MDVPGSAPDVTREDVRSVFTRFDDPSTPVTAAEVAEAVDCDRETARHSLDELVEADELRTRRLEETRVWWRSDASAGRDDTDEFHAFVSAVKDYAIFMLDPDGTVVSWNEGAERIKGYEADDIVGEHFSTFYTDADVAADVPDRNLAAAATEGRVEDEGWRVRADGSRFRANVTITAVRGDDGTLRGFTKVTRDVTERCESERRLQRERDLTERILETVPVSIGVVDADGRLVRANGRMLDRHGIDASALPEHSITSLDAYDADGDPIPVADWPWKRVLEDGEPVYGFQCQVELPADGREWISVNAAPLEDDGSDDERVVLAIDQITEQKEREQRLRREYHQTEGLLRTAPVGIAVQNADRETVLANRRAQEALGLSEREFADDPVENGEWEIYDATGDPLDPAETPSARVLETGEPVFDEELVFEPPDGDRMHFRINAAPLFGPDGEIERVIIGGKDITELKERERQLERRKTKLETELGEIFGRISDAFYALDDEYRFTHLNDRAVEPLDRSKEELLGRTVWDVIPDASVDRYRERFRTAMETQEPATFEIYEPDFDAWYEYNLYPSESGLSVYFRDITDRVEYERQLAKYETIVETIDDGIYVKDEDGHFTMVNDAYAALTGYDREELIGEHASLVVDEDTIEQSRETLTASGDGRTPAMEAEIHTAEGDRVPVEGTFATLRTDDSQEEIGVVRDVTDRKERERELEASNERLEQFAYAASHDLQEPLRMVTSYLQLLEKRYADDLDADAREFIEFAVDGADRMREMIDGLLEYSRVDTRGDPLEPVALDDVLEDAIGNLQVRIEESHAEITSEPLPRVRGDESQLQQVLQNLLNNAIEYSGAEPPRVRIAAERGDAKHVISVSDEGIGIDPAEQDRIFEVFQRLHGREDHPGTGIGLSLCRRIVERHDGTIRVDSEPGEGTTFSVTLPAA
jgi:PAS domain S-box-containing protein